MANTKKVLSKDQVTKANEVIKGIETKSGQMRALSAAGWKPGDISRVLTTIHGKLVRPQFVHNVLNRPLKKS